MTDQHISLAAQLRRARESRGVSLDQAHQVTGISLKVLGGLESDSTELVELIYMRLAMISYADYLGLDVGETARRNRACRLASAASCGACPRLSSSELASPSFSCSC